MATKSFLATLEVAGSKVKVYSPKEYSRQMEQEDDGRFLEVKRAAMARGATVEDPRVDLAVRRDENGLLYWGPLEAATATEGKRAWWFDGMYAEPVTIFSYARPKPNEFVDKLIDGDAACNERQVTHAMWRLSGGSWERCEKADVAGYGRVLLFVHGTFSNNDDGFLKQLQGKENHEGQALLTAVEKANYDAVLGFEHPTMSVSPMVNALDLNEWFRESKASVDVIAHSRGGLVTRWWLEHTDEQRAERPKVRAVFAGSTLDGTSLASPPALLTAADRWLNVAELMAKSAKGNPEAVGMMTGLFSIIKLVGASTAFNALGVLVPGLAAQAKVSNNVELIRLNGDDGLTRLTHRAEAGKLEYFTLRGNFESAGVEYEFLTKKVGKLKELEPVFPGAHDLVVDQGSMRLMERNFDRDKVFIKDHKFDPGATVFHTNYFEQADTCKKIREWLGLP